MARQSIDIQQDSQLSGKAVNCLSLLGVQVAPFQIPTARAFLWQDSDLAHSIFQLPYNVLVSLSWYKFYTKTFYGNWKID